ncbi:MAG: DNA primase [Deltaproteobacteria bacterium]|nr:DNA primase [Deltaproteobacteria bacterium]
MRYPDSAIDDVCRLTDLVALVRGYVDLKPAGRSWKGLCPFHNEKTPSFHVDAEKNLYYCFGCGKGGGPITFLMEIGGKGFVEALEELAERAGYKLPVLSQGPAARKGPDRAAIYEVMRQAQEFFVGFLAGPRGGKGVEYLAGRGISVESVRTFGLGLAPDDWGALVAHLGSLGFPRNLLLEAGLARKAAASDHVYDAFRNRVMFPIMDGLPRVIAFAGRTFVAGDDSAKYVNSPTTAVYEKGRHLYGFNLARPHVKGGGVVFLVEGYFDAISMHAGGVKAVAAVMGTALTQFQVNLLRGVAREVLLVFDGDSAGMEAAKRALPLLYNADLDGRVIILPGGHDPDSFIREFGGRSFYDLADQAQDLSEFYLSRLLAVNAATMTGQGRIITEMQDILRQVPDAAKGQFLRNKLADRLGLSADHLSLRPGGLPQAPAVPGGRPQSAASPGGRSRADYDFVAGRLLRFAIIHQECQGLFDDRLLEIWPQDRTRYVFETLLGQLRAGSAIRPGALRLEDDPQMSALVSEATLRPRECGPQEAMAMARDMITKLESHAGKRLNEEFTRAIRMAEAAGDQEAVMRLLAAKQR